MVQALSENIQSYEHLVKLLKNCSDQDAIGVVRALRAFDDAGRALEWYDETTSTRKQLLSHGNLKFEDAVPENVDGMPSSLDGLSAGPHFGDPRHERANWHPALQIRDSWTHLTPNITEIGSGSYSLSPRFEGSALV